jgi:hypothetical protein
MNRSDTGSFLSHIDDSRCLRGGGNCERTICTVDSSLMMFEWIIGIVRYAIECNHYQLMIIIKQCIIEYTLRLETVR